MQGIPLTFDKSQIAERKIKIVAITNDFIQGFLNTVFIHCENQNATNYVFYIVHLRLSSLNFSPKVLDIISKQITLSSSFSFLNMASIRFSILSNTSPAPVEFS